eukprot:PhF_6_TR10347/c0_g1_i2/m.15954
MDSVSGEQVNQHHPPAHTPPWSLLFQQVCSGGFYTFLVNGVPSMDDGPDFLCGNVSTNTITKYSGHDGKAKWTVQFPKGTGVSYNTGTQNAVLGAKNLMYYGGAMINL